MSEVKAGYKQTEVGVIPEDWAVETLGDIFTFGGGYSASRDQLSSDGHCYLHYGDIHKSTKSFIDVRAEYPDIPKLNIPLKRISPKSRLHNGDVVFVDASEDDEGTSKHIVVVNNEDITYISGLHTIVAKSKEGVLDNGYKRYCFQSRDIKSQFYFYSVGTKVSGISKTNIGKLQLPIPPLPEQQAIASALTDVDALITALGQLITKKRNIKQGAMQQLLTGEKRLPGFGGEWIMKKIENIAPLQRGFDLPNNELKKGEYPVVYSNGIVNYHCAYKLKAPGVVTGRSGTIGKVTFVEEDYWPHNTSLWVTDFKGNDPKFIFYLYLKTKLERFGTGSGVPTLNRNDVHSFEISIPSKKKEQQAIAKILSDMDTEIEALEQKQAKYKTIKQGMMQELLTGKTRLL